MAKDIKLDQLLGITKEPLETMSHTEMLKNNLKVQHDKISQEIFSLENQSHRPSFPRRGLRRSKAQ